jgi:hypothetical protein
MSESSLARLRSGTAGVESYFVSKLFRQRFLFDHHDLVPESCLARWSGVKFRLTVWIATKAEHVTFRTADVRGPRSQESC